MAVPAQSHYITSSLVLFPVDMGEENQDTTNHSRKRKKLSVADRPTTNAETAVKPLNEFVARSRTPLNTKLIIGEHNEMNKLMEFLKIDCAKKPMTASKRRRLGGLHWTTDDKNIIHQGRVGGGGLGDVHRVLLLFQTCLIIDVQYYHRTGNSERPVFP